MGLKLFKHEIKAQYKVILLSWAAILLVSLLSRITNHFLEREIFNKGLMVLNGVMFLLFMSSVILGGMFVMIYVVINLYKTTFGKKGYFTHQIPMSSTKILLIKYLVAALITVLTTGIIILAFYVRSGIMFKEIMNMNMPLSGYENPRVFMIKYGLSMLSGTLFGIMSMYLSMAIGQLANSKKILFSILSYFGIYTIIQIIMTTTMITFMLSNMKRFEGMAGPSAEYYFVNNTFNITIISTIVLTIGFFFLTDYITKKKLNY